MIERHPIVWLLLDDLAQGIDGVTVQQGNCEQVMGAGSVGTWSVGSDVCAAQEKRCPAEGYSICEN